MAIILFAISLFLSGDAGKMQKQLQNRQKDWGTVQDSYESGFNRLDKKFELSSVAGLCFGYLGIMFWLISISRAFKNNKKPRFQMIVLFIMLFFFLLYVSNFMNYIDWSKPFWLYEAGH